MEETKDLTLIKPGEITVNPDSPMAMFQIAASQGMDLDRLDKMLDLQEKWEQRESKKAYIRAMSEFKANPPTLLKQSKVEYGNTKYSYASLDHVAEEINSTLSKYGMFASWTQDQSGDAIKVTCKISHQDGHFEETSLMSKPDNSGGKNAIQGLGSAITYLQRYTLLALTGLAAKGMDTDGNFKNGNKLQRNAPKESDVPDAVIKEPVVDTEPVEGWKEFIARKKIGKAEIKKLEDYIAESAKSLGMEPEALKENAINAGDLETMFEAVMAGSEDKPAQGNWFDQSKHWSFREKDALKELILFGFGERSTSKVCNDNPDAYNVLKQALPETKKTLVKKYDKMFGAGEFNKLIGK